jgi:AcrR family transcriptional regulator
MAVKERRQRESDEMRRLILSAASEIVAAEGIEGLSIRKLTQRIEYSPAIIYHYFKDKGDIINNLMRQGYRDIVSVVSSAQSKEPGQRLEEMTRGYIAAALAMPEIYRAVLTSGSPEALSHTSALFSGARESRRAVDLLCRCLEDMAGNEKADGREVELTAQVIWTSTFGLVIRLILEKELPEAQREALITKHIKMVINTASALYA